MENPTKKSKVYFKRFEENITEENIKEGLLSLWHRSKETLKLQNKLTALKLSLEYDKYIRPDWIKPIIDDIKKDIVPLFIVQNNLLTEDNKSNAIELLMLLDSYGYNTERLGIPVIIGDGLIGQDSQALQVRGDHLDSAKIAKTITESEAIILINTLTTYKGKYFSGAIKGLGMDTASLSGKLIQLSRSLPEVDIEKCVACGTCIKVCPANAIGLKKKKAILVKERCIACAECAVSCKVSAIKIMYDENPVKFQEKMVEYALGVKSYFKSRALFINILPDNLGLVAGNDPVSVDKASIDIIQNNPAKGSFNDIDLKTQFEHAEKIKLGSTQYEIEEL
ncbi:MAG: DUF362 domain-containing protein [Candidatus Omnitrophota bacterium]